MNEICGWAGPLASEQARAEALARISVTPKPKASLSVPVHANGAIAAVGSRTWIYHDDQVTVAICGHPVFRDTTGGLTLPKSIAHAYLAGDTSLLEELHGPFSLAIVDLRDGSAVLAIDRLGIEPMAYATVDDVLIFATRADSVAAHPLATTDIDPQSLYDYLYFHCVPSPRTIYAGQRKLLPGQVVRFAGGEVRASFYWRLQYHSESVPFERLREEFLTLQEAAVRRAAQEERLGAFLSGGTDSSTIAGMLSRVQGAGADTYSIGFSADGYDEMEYARIAARHFGTRAHEYYVTPQDVVEAIPMIAAAYDEPFGNASAVPAYYCARMATGDGVSTMLAGDGGDEIFGGNVRYARQMVFEAYRHIPAWLRSGFVEPVVSRLPGAAHVPPLRKLRSYIEQARCPLPDRLEAYNFLHRTPLADIFEPEFLSFISLGEPLESLREVYNRTSSPAPIHRMMHLDLKVTLADNDLRKVNRMCELAGVGVCYPMLDEQLVEFSARVPAHMQVRHFRLRYFFKRALKDFLPREILTKSKHGFGLPFGLWLREHKPLQELANDSLRTLQNRGMLRREYIDTILDQHREQHASYYGVMIWVLMMLEQWLQAHGH